MLFHILVNFRHYIRKYKDKDAGNRVCGCRDMLLACLAMTVGKTCHRVVYGIAIQC